MANRSGNARQPFETIPDKVTDPATREALDRIQQFLSGMLMSRFDGDHFEIVIPKATGQTSYLYPHSFRFTPKDVWITHQTMDFADSVKVDYLNTDGTNIAFDIGNVPNPTPPDLATEVTVRFFAGIFTEGV